MRIILTLALGLLVGCGGTTGSNGGQSRAVVAAALTESLALENISDPQALPTSGRVTYSGFMTLGLPIGSDTNDYVGDLTLAVDFGATRNQLSGSAGNFDGLDGMLQIAGGDLYRNADPNVDDTFDGGLTGTLTQGSDSYVIDGDISGNFLGRFQDGLTGVVYGDITGPAGQDLFQGDLAATRDN